MTQRHHHLGQGLGVYGLSFRTRCDGVRMEKSLFEVKIKVKNSVFFFFANAAAHHRLMDALFANRE
jgi:hypothetical protein